MKKGTLIREYLQKLKNKRGSALLISLLFSIVSIIIATVILNAATSSSRRVEKTAESSQSYYLVSSLFGVFGYEATSPKANPEQSIYADKGMVFTADISFDPEENELENNVIANIDTENASGITKELSEKTNLSMLKYHIAHCLTQAILSGQTASRTFTVTVGGDSAEGENNGYNCHEYVLSCVLSVNPVDYSIRIIVTGIKDNDDATNKLGLPEIRTLIMPTEKVNVLRVETVGEKKRPTKVEFVYQKAKYLPES